MPSKSPPAPVKLIIAGSSYFIDKKINEVYQELEQSGTVEYHTFFADEASAAEINALAFTISIFSDVKILTIHHAETLKKDSDIFKELDKAACASIIITSLDIKKAETLAKTLPNFLLQTEKKIYAGDITKEIQAVFSKRGLEVNAQTASAISATFDNDMITIEQEAEKISLYYAKQHNVSNQDILNRINGEPRETIWKFIDSFMALKVEQCIKIFTLLPDRDASASQIFYMLTMYFAGIYFKHTHPALANTKNPFFNGKD